MELKDYYSIMGVKRTDDLKTIKTAYRRLARKYHPDVSKEANAAERFKEIAEAWAVLSDKEKRAEYDEMWEHRNDPYFNQFNRGQQGHSYSQQDFEAGDFEDIFSSMFSQRARSSGSQSRNAYSKRGQDLEVELPVFLEESQKAHKQTISYRLPVYNAYGFVEDEIPKTLNVTIPAGVIDGQRIRLKGQGTAGLNGGENGDIWITIRLAPHPLFDIKGKDLEIVVPLAPWEAALGTKVTVPTLHDPIVITIPANSQAGQKLRLKGKGMLHKGGAGDLYAIIKIVMPTTSNAESDELWKKLAETQQSFDPRKNWGGK
ncbi:curved DNA-binding protein [Providencia sneebia]|uniref:Curved DNA-binding protein CbpA n=1 Tax=Providencia sneebia DSM 19967 TaxID=1141660 RepID=K8WHY6_9GAMM|nr:curved DNA-binding protein [Providencia sneebia]EKT60159.1 curved DNA-binding protein CbpA [Providencia sneebia DSM 19967]